MSCLWLVSHYRKRTEWCIFWLVFPILIMFFTALEASEAVPKMEVATECLLHHEKKMKNRPDAGDEEAMAARHQQVLNKGPRCYHCKKFGHIKHNCDKFKSFLEKKSAKQSVCNVATAEDEDSSGSESVGLVVRHALAACSSESHNKWIIDSGATCHMCNCRDTSTNLDVLTQPVEVTLGDGYALKAEGKGRVTIKTKLQKGKTHCCTLHDVLLVTKLAYNLVSVAKIGEAGKRTEFNENECRILDNDQVIATEYRVKVSTISILRISLFNKQPTFLVLKARRVFGIDASAI